MLHNLHSHTTLSDGELSPMELLRRFHAAGYVTVGVTDHAALGGVARIVAEVREDARLAREHLGITVLVGVELTHAPAKTIPELARSARNAGADLVVVHGETLVEPTPEGPNMAAASCPDVDILAHPGLLTREVAVAARENCVLLEITARKGHCLTNGHVARMAAETGAGLIFGLDAHSPSDIVSEAMRDRILAGAGLDPESARRAAEEAPLELVARARG